jgi:hypothetical protein
MPPELLLLPGGFTGKLTPAKAPARGSGPPGGVQWYAALRKNLQKI